MTQEQDTQSTQEFDYEELLLLLLRLCTAGAAANEACGATIVTSSRATGSNHTNTASNRQDPDLHVVS